MRALPRWPLLVGLLFATGVASADPCGMVPPVWDGEGPAITRIGDQITYVFYKDGLESFVIRPGFSGKVDEFGMLIPFPTPPAIRKVEDPIFDHVAKAVDPPEVVVDLRMFEMERALRTEGAVPAPAAAGGLAVQEDSVRVIREEAVGMYEVAVLEAGSAKALQRWLDDHGYRYPEGMGPVAQEYVADGWCFVAVKTKVGVKRKVTPRPGMREADPAMPKGATFDGNVQAMGFRFRSERLVVPMRLSAFNAGRLHNIVYVLTDGPVRADGLGDDLVVRQVAGKLLRRNLTAPLPLRVIGGTIDDIPEDRRRTLPQERDPTPHNGFAKTLFAGDLLAARLGVLALPHEEREKELLRIGERLSLRGPELDALHREALAAQAEEAAQQALADLDAMTLTIIDGDFDRETIARDNLHFASYSLPSEKNDPRRYDAVRRGPAPRRLPGVRYESEAPPAPAAEGAPPAPTATPTPRPRALWITLGVVLGLAALGVFFSRSSQAS